MWLGGDPDDIRRHAARLRGLADTVAGEYATAQRRLAGVQWESAAAQAFRAQSLDDLGIYDRAVGELDNAARDLDRLADELASRQRALVEIAERVGRTAEDLWCEARRTGEDVLAYADHVLDDIGQGVSDGLHKGRHLLDTLTGGLL